LLLCGITSSNPFPSVPGLYTAVTGSSIYRDSLLQLPENLVNGGECVNMPLVLFSSNLLSQILQFIALGDRMNMSGFQSMPVSR
jgi:hypothetical protein